MAYKFNDYEPENRQLIIDTANGRRVSFSVSQIEPATQQWLGEILSRMFREEIDDAVRVAVQSNQAAMRNLLGIK